MIEAQRAARKHVADLAGRDTSSALRRLEDLLEGSGIDAVGLIDLIGSRLTVTVNFHPDRLAADGRSVIDHLLEDGRYRSQFETRISNGGLTAFDGGDRDRWEQAFFGDAYRDAPPHSRPKYGAADVLDSVNGASPRFGSCHLRLTPDAATRTTFSFGDSVSQPTVWGVVEALAPLVTAIVDGVAAGDGLLGHPCQRPADLVSTLQERPDVRGGLLNRELDAYVEAQFHDDLDLARDVDALVMDASFVGTNIGASFDELGRRHGLTIRETPAFHVKATTVPSELRGPEAAALAPLVAGEFGDGVLIDAATIGRAAVSVVREPERWAGASAADLLQQIKYLWHALVLLG